MTRTENDMRMNMESHSRIALSEKKRLDHISLNVLHTMQRLKLSICSSYAHDDLQPHAHFLQVRQQQWRKVRVVRSNTQRPTERVPHTHTDTHTHARACTCKCDSSDSATVSDDFQPRGPLMISIPVSLLHDTPAHSSSIVNELMTFVACFVVISSQIVHDLNVIEHCSIVAVFCKKRVCLLREGCLEVGIHMMHFGSRSSGLGAQSTDYCTP